MQAYAALEQRFDRRAAIRDALGILHWDTETTMPEGAAPYRAEATATLQGIAHDLLTAAETGELLARAEADAAALGEWQRANLREMRRLYDEDAAVPRDLIEANAKAVVGTRVAWREARSKSDFGLLRGPLGELAGLQRAIGAAKGGRAGLDAYDALLDGFDPGLRAALVDGVFAALRARLPDLIHSAAERQARLPAPQRPAGPFAAAAQRRLAEDLMRALGFDFTRGRLDRSAHPFCGGATDDVRITQNANDDDFLGSLMALFHECGHALYQQGLPRAFLHQPVGQPRGLTLHESQALLMELQACATPEFAAYLAPLARQAFGGAGAAWSADNLFRLMTAVEPSLIRIDADEMTYVLHAIIRYDLEKAIITGDLAVADLPGAYNGAVHKSLGLTVPDDRSGCLQDIHWAAGLWGYFPSYALGAIVAAQLFEAACRAHPDLPAGLARGDFRPLRDWLRSHVHDRGSLMETDALIAAATGAQIEAAPYLAYLRRRYVAAD